MGVAGRQVRVAIVGSRNYPQMDKVWTLIERLAKKDPAVIIVSGGARGVDTVAAAAARIAGLAVEELLPDWTRYGNEAGFERNTRIVAVADRVIAFWDGASGGTRDTLEKARLLGKPVLVILPSR